VIVAFAIVGTGLWDDARMVAAVAAALAAAVALAAPAPAAVLLVAVALAQGLLVSRWCTALGVPGHVGAAVLAGVAALSADVLVVARDETRPLAPAAAVLGVALPAALLHQLVRRDGRPRVVGSLVATTSLAAVAVLGTGHLGAQLSRGGAALVVVAVVAAGAVTVLHAVALPMPAAARLAVGPAVAVALGVVVGLLTDLGAATAALVAVGCAVTAMVGVTLAGRVPHPEPFVSAALPLVLVGPVGFVLGRLLVG
jgi:hypothetical protein